MKAVRMTRWKHGVEILDVPEPGAGPGEVVVRIGGAGACHSDLHVLHDFEGDAMPWGPPFTMGHENAGWVHSIGSGVSGLSVGDAVAVYGPWGCGHCPRCRVGMENYCDHQATIGAAGGGLGRDGGMAPLMLVPQSRWLVPLGDLDPVQAAPLTDAGLTPYHAIKRSLPLLTPTATAVVIGAGGLGQMAVQILRALTAARIIVVDQRAGALETALALGADLAVLAGDAAADEVLELTSGLGAEVVLDIVGADATLALAVAITRTLGHLTIVGIGGGSLPMGFGRSRHEVSVATTYWGSLPELHEVIALAATGRITTRVERFGLDDVAEVYRRMAAGELDGRAVIVPN